MLEVPGWLEAKAARHAVAVVSALQITAWVGLDCNQVSLSALATP